MSLKDIAARDCYFFSVKEMSSALLDLWRVLKAMPASGLAPAFNSRFVCVIMLAVVHDDHTHALLYGTGLDLLVPKKGAAFG